MSYKLFDTKILKSKKAASVDNFYVAISFFIFAIAMVIALKFWDIISTGDIDTNVLSATATGVQIKANGQEFFSGMDGFVLLVYFIIHLAMVLVAYMLRTHPIMYVIGIFMIIILIYITVPLTESWNTFTANDAFTTEMTNLKITNYLMNNLTTLEMIWGFITIIILAGLARGEGIV